MNTHIHSTREARLLHLAGPLTPSSGSGTTPPERINATNAPTVIPNVRQRLTALRQQIQEVDASGIDEQRRVAILEHTHAQLDTLRDILTPASGPALSAPHEPERVALVGEVQTTQQTVASRMQRLRELATNSVYQFFKNTGMGAPFRMITGLFSGIGPIFSDIGNLVGPTMQAIWKPFQRMGSPIMNFFSGIAAKFSPAMAEQMRVRAQAERQKEIVVERFTYHLGRMTPPRSLPPANARTDDDAEHITTLFQMQQRSGRTENDFASLVVRRLPTTTPNSVPLGTLVSTAELVFPVDAAPTTGTTPERTTVETKTISIESHADANPIGVINGDTILVNAQTATITGAIQYEGTAVVVGAGTGAGARGGVVNVTDASGMPLISLQRINASSPALPNQANGAVEIKVIARPATRGLIRRVEIGGKTIRLQFP